MGLLGRLGLRRDPGDTAEPPDGRAKLRLGIIGPGLIWQRKHRIELEQHAGRVELVAVCARSQESFDAAGLPDARRHADIDGLVNDEGVEAVMVLTPIALNAEASVAALQAGKDVFVEKPLGASLEACRAVLAAEAQTGKRVFVLEQSVYRADIVRARALLAERRIGELVLFDRVDHFLFDAGAHDMGGFGKTGWRREPDYPLGAMFDAGVHAIAQLTALFGVPEHVRASGKKWREGFGDYDEVLVQLDFASGLRGVFSQSAALPNAHTGFHVRGTEGVLCPTGKSVQITDLEGASEDLPAEGNDMWARLLDARDSGEPAPYTPLDAARDVAVLEAVDRSIRSGAREPVEPVR